MSEVDARGVAGSAAGRQVLVCNCGSSSLKVDVFDFAEGAERQLAGATVGRLGTPQAEVRIEVAGVREEEAPGELDHAGALRLVAERLAAGGVFLAADRGAVGHRVVHGAHYVSEAVRVNESVLALIERCEEYAPLHNPANLSGIRSALELFAVPQVAVFDTAFHASLPAHAYSYALPHELIERHNLRRYGFHGPSHEYVAGELADRLGRPLGELRLITLHLGNGASACAVRSGRSVETSMGFTPLEGLVMGTRTGDLDPAIPGILMEKEGLDPDGLDELLNRKSGLLGLGGHRDMRDLLAAAGAGDERAALARDVFCHRIRRYVGAYLAVLGGIDAIAFTAGIGENSAEVRARSLAGLEGLGIALDPARNQAPPDGGRVSPEGAAVPVFVVATDEERMIARQTARLVLAGHG